MSVVLRTLIVLLVLLTVGGMIALAVSGLSPTIERVEIVIPDDRFPR